MLLIDIGQKSVAWSAIFLFIVPVQGAPTISTPNVCFPLPRFYPSLCSPTSTTHDALALLSASRLSVLLFPIPFLLSLFLVHLTPYSLFGSSSFLPPSCAVSPIADFPPLPLSYLTVFFQLKTTVHTLSVAFCLSQCVASTYFLTSAYFPSPLFFYSLSFEFIYFSPKFLWLP